MKKYILALMLLVSPAAFANVLGEMQTFAPNTDGLDFITVHTARPLNKGYFAFSNYLNYAKDHLLVYENFPGQEQMSYSNHFFEYDFGIAYAFTERLQLSLMIPVLLDYSGEEKNGIHINVSKGWHSLRPGAKYTLYNGSSWSWAGLFSLDEPQVTNSPYTGVDPQPIFNYELAALLKSGKFNHGFNFGYRKRLPSETPGDAQMFPLKDQAIASYGLSAPAFKSSRFVFEIFGSYPINKDPYEKAIDASSLDVLLAMKHLWWKYLRFDWGVTVEPGVKTLSPSWRAFAGLVYYWKNDLIDSGNPISEEQQMVLYPLTAYPQAETLIPGEKRIFSASGGTAPYKCRLVSGKGSLDTETCTYQVADPDNNVVVEFQDSLGEIANGSLVAEKESLYINAPQDEVFVRSLLPLEVGGGETPYSFSVKSGGGSVNSKGEFRAPGQPGFSVVAVEDLAGNQAEVRIQVLEIPRADKVIHLKNLKFISGKDQLTPSSEKDFNHNIQELKGEKIRQIIVEGHTDDVGSSESNLELSEKRAQAVKKRLISRLGLKSNQIKAVGFGEEQALTTNATPAGRQINRRVELKVYEQK